LAAQIRVVEVTSDNLSDTPVCGIKDREHEGRQAKERWLRLGLKQGLRARVLLTEKGSQFGYAEWLPGEQAWRGVDASGYMLLHCIWTFYTKYQNRGHGAALVQACLDDAREAGMRGVATVARDRPWLAGSALFLKEGFELADTAPPDYELLVKKLDPGAPDPRFRGDWTGRLKRYGSGLTIIRAEQCPHSIRFAEKVAARARTRFGLEPRMITLRTWRQAQAAPTPFTVFAILYDGELVADHHVSARRFETLMGRVLDRKPP
jgi:GNAT superfamily N-acetyltransferase